MRSKQLSTILNLSMFEELGLVEAYGIEIAMGLNVDLLKDFV
jgi:hypothetical protein